MVDNLITLYDSNERNFTTNGLGTLVDASECTVEEELNGAFELTMSYPIDGQHYTDLGIGKIIFAKPNRQSEKEPFRIYSISTPLSGAVTVKAQHISYDLSGYILPKFNTDYSESGEAYATGPRTAFARIESELAKIPEYSDFPFTFYTDSDEDYAGQDVMYELTCPTPKSVRNLLGSGDGSMLSVYSGEYYFNRFTVNFLVQRGSDNGVTLRYGKNLTSLTVDEDASTLYSGVYPFWRGTVTEKDANGQDVQNEKCIELPEKIIAITEDAPKNVYLMDLSSDYTSWPGDENVREIVEKYISDNALGLPFSSLKVSYEQLSKSNEYSSFINFDSVELGDYVTVEYGALLSGPQKVRCTKISYDVLLDKIESIDLGSESTLTDSISQQQSTLSNSTNYTREYVQEQLSNISYDTALSTTSTNAVQNKVVTSKFNTIDKTCNGFKNEINNILSIVENLNPSGGAAITYGYSLPTGGNNGDAYVQITSTPKDPRAVVSESTVHNNFEVSNFTQSGTKYSFDISGTVDADQINYALVNVDNLRSGSEYKVKMRLSHDVPTASLDRSYYRGGHWTKAFGLFVGTKNNLKTDYVNDQSSGNWFDNNDGLNEVRGWEDEIRNVGPSACYQPQMQYQGFYKDVSDREYDFYFTASGTSASFGFVFDDCQDETACNVSVVDMEVIYVGSPKIPVNWGSVGSSFANATWNDNWMQSQGISDITSNSAWTNWGGGNNYTPEPIIGFTFNQATMIDRIRLNVWEGADYDDLPDVVRTVYIEASTDDEAWNSENKEWINVLPSNTSVDIPYPWNHIDHVYFNINKGTYHDIRVRFVSPAESGKLEAIQCYFIEEQIPDNHVKDLFFKIDGEWLVYPNDPEDEDTTFGYGVEDPTSETINDIYAKMEQVEIDKGTQYGSIEKILYKIDNDWKEAPSSGGGGGGSGVTRETIYTGAQRENTITLSKSIANYDYLILQAVATISGSNYYNSNVLSVSDIISSGTNYVGVSDDIAYLWYELNSNTSLSFSGASGNYYIKSIDGIKFSGGSGGGSGFAKTLLWDSGNDEGAGAQMGTVYTLSGNLSKYDMVYVEYGTYIDRSQHGQYDIPILPRYFDVTSSLLSGYDQGMADYYQRFCYIRFTDTTFEITRQGCPGESSGYEPRPYKMYGIKFSGGGSGGSERTDLLYSASGTTAPNTITLAHPYTDYEKLYISMYGVYNSGKFLIETTPFVADLEVNLKIGGVTEDGYCWYTITDTQTLSKYSTGGGNGYHIKSIRGIGSSGS